MDQVKRTERGWSGHFCGAAHCRFRRNTLLEYNSQAVVVSTVGNYHPFGDNMEEVSIGRDYEIMAFFSDKSAYNDADTSKQVYFDSPWQYKINDNDDYPDITVNNMHEAVVKELSEKLLSGELKDKD